MESQQPTEAGTKPVRGLVALKTVRNLLDSLESDLQWKAQATQDEAVLKVQVEEALARAVKAEREAESMASVISMAASIAKVPPDGLLAALRTAFQNPPPPAQTILRGQVVLYAGQHFLVDDVSATGAYPPDGARLKKVGQDYVVDPYRKVLHDIEGYDPALLSKEESFPIGTLLRNTREGYDAVITGHYFDAKSGRLKYRFMYQNKPSGSPTNGALLSSLVKGYGVVSIPSKPAMVAGQGSCRTPVPR